jgi:dihydroneopterin aldolase/D-erythro-7,8-dihydroneopterin triphosphate epimerase
MSEVMDKIYIRDLLLRCIVGIYPEERENKQDVIINIEMTCDLSAAAASDQIEDTVNYKAVKKEIMALVENSAFLLIERMAGEIASVCLDHPGVFQVRVTVDKPGALRFARSVAVEVVRSRAKADG